MLRDRPTLLSIKPLLQLKQIDYRFLEALPSILILVWNCLLSLQLNPEFWQWFHYREERLALCELLCNSEIRNLQIPNTMRNLITIYHLQNTDMNIKSRLFFDDCTLRISYQLDAFVTTGPSQYTSFSFVWVSDFPKIVKVKP